MNMNTLVKQALESAQRITGKGADDAETQEIAFKLACVAAAEEAAK